MQNQKFYEPKDFGFKYEDVYIPQANNKRLHAWFFSSIEKPAKGLIVYFHGNAENITTHFLSLAWITRYNYDFLIWDYPGYGLSDGQAEKYAIRAAASDVLKWAYQKNLENKNKFVVYGASLGGNIALRAVQDVRQEVKISGLILESTFLSYRSVARDKLSDHWFTWLFQPLGWLLVSDATAPDQPVQLSPIPVFVVHGNKDPVMPYKFGVDLFEKTSEPKKFLHIEGGGHIDSFFRDNYRHRPALLEYLNGLSQSN